MTAALEVDGLRHRYDEGAEPVTALDGVSLTVGCGEVVALLGPNGAGKSTLVSIIAGILQPTAGSVDRMVATLGLAPQDEALYPTLSARANLRHFGRLAGLSGPELEDRIVEVASELLIAAVLDRKVRHLSGGERRRVHAAAALVPDPRLVLLDEPTAGVDVETRVELLASIRRRADRGAAVLYSTHYLQEVEQLDARVVMLANGRVVAEGRPDELARRFADRVVELRFDRPGVALPPPLDAWSVADAGDPARFTITLPDGERLSTVLDRLGPAREALESAAMSQPTFEQAFRRLTGAGPVVGEVGVT
ncbi:MAG TPA: ABC transporter ATP-binding protein [Microthrixaceae bacterium]|nr:ABC transporter ATP-binding protein [Microthrixaceae bacterium]